MHEQEKVMAYVSRLAVIENRLCGIGYNITETDLVRAILRGLRNDFAVTADIIRGMNTNRSAAIGLLMNKEGSPKLSSSSHRSGSTGNALKVVHGRRKTKYHYCGKLGHIKRFCFENPNSPKYKGNDSGTGKKSMSANENSQSEAINGSDNIQTTGAKAHLSLGTMALTSKGDSERKSKWYVDSGCTSHMTNDATFLEDLGESGIKSVSVGSGASLEVRGAGTLKAVVQSDGVKTDVKLENVLYVPQLTCNLLSVSRMRRRGIVVLFDQCDNGRGFVQLKVKESGASIAKGFEVQEGLFELLLHPTKSQVSAANVCMTDKVKLWHQRLGHMGHNIINKSVKITKGIDVSGTSSREVCDDC